MAGYVYINTEGNKPDLSIDPKLGEILLWRPKDNDPTNAECERINRAADNETTAVDEQGDSNTVGSLSLAISPQNVLENYYSELWDNLAKGTNKPDAIGQFSSTWKSFEKNSPSAKHNLTNYSSLDSFFNGHIQSDQPKVISDKWFNKYGQGAANDKWLGKLANSKHSPIFNPYQKRMDYSTMMAFAGNVFKAWGAYKALSSMAEKENAAADAINNFDTEQESLAVHLRAASYKDEYLKQFHTTGGSGLIGYNSIKYFPGRQHGYGTLTDTQMLFHKTTWETETLIQGWYGQYDPDSTVRWEANSGALGNYATTLNQQGTGVTYRNLSPNSDIWKKSNFMERAADKLGGVPAMPTFGASKPALTAYLYYKLCMFAVSGLASLFSRLSEGAGGRGTKHVTKFQTSSHTIKNSAPILANTFGQPAWVTSMKTELQEHDPFQFLEDLWDGAVNTVDSAIGVIKSVFGDSTLIKGETGESHAYHQLRRGIVVSGGSMQKSQRPSIEIESPEEQMKRKGENKLLHRLSSQRKDWKRAKVLLVTRPKIAGGTAYEVTGVKVMESGMGYIDADVEWTFQGPNYGVKLKLEMYDEVMLVVHQYYRIVVANMQETMRAALSNLSSLKHLAERKTGPTGKMNGAAGGARPVFPQPSTRIYHGQKFEHKLPSGAKHVFQAHCSLPAGGASKDCGSSKINKGNWARYSVGAQTGAHPYIDWVAKEIKLGNTVKHAKWDYVKKAKSSAGDYWVDPTNGCLSWEYLGLKVVKQAPCCKGGVAGSLHWFYLQMLETTLADLARKMDRTYMIQAGFFTSNIEGKDKKNRKFQGYGSLLAEANMRIDRIGRPVQVNMACRGSGYQKAPLEETYAGLQLRGGGVARKGIRPDGWQEYEILVPKQFPNPTVPNKNFWVRLSVPDDGWDEDPQQQANQGKTVKQINEKTYGISKIIVEFKRHENAVAPVADIFTGATNTNETVLEKRWLAQGQGGNTNVPVGAERGLYFVCRPYIDIRLDFVYGGATLMAKPMRGSQQGEQSSPHTQWPKNLQELMATRQRQDSIKNLRAWKSVWEQNRDWYKQYFLSWVRKPIEPYYSVISYGQDSAETTVQVHLRPEVGRYASAWRREIIDCLVSMKPGGVVNKGISMDADKITDAEKKKFQLAAVFMPTFGKCDNVSLGNMSKGLAKTFFTNKAAYNLFRAPSAIQEGVCQKKVCGAVHAYTTVPPIGLAEGTGPTPEVGGKTKPWTKAKFDPLDVCGNVEITWKFFPTYNTAIAGTHGKKKVDLGVIWFGQRIDIQHAALPVLQAIHSGPDNARAYTSPKDNASGQFFKMHSHMYGAGGASRLFGNNAVHKSHYGDITLPEVWGGWSQALGARKDKWYKSAINSVSDLSQTLGTIWDALLGTFFVNANDIKPDLSIWTPGSLYKNVGMEYTGDAQSWCCRDGISWGTLADKQLELVGSIYARTMKERYEHLRMSIFGWSPYMHEIGKGKATPATLSNLDDWSAKAFKENWVWAAESDQGYIKQQNIVYMHRVHACKIMQGWWLDLQGKSNIHPTQQKVIKDTKWGTYFGTAGTAQMSYSDFGKGTTNEGQDPLSITRKLSGVCFPVVRASGIYWKPLIIGVSGNLPDNFDGWSMTPEKVEDRQSYGNTAFHGHSIFENINGLVYQEGQAENQLGMMAGVPKAIQNARPSWMDEHDQHYEYPLVNPHSKNGGLNNPFYIKQTQEYSTFKHDLASQAVRESFQEVSPYQRVARIEGDGGRWPVYGTNSPQLGDIEQDYENDANKWADDNDGVYEKVPVPSVQTTFLGAPPRGDFENLAKKLDVEIGIWGGLFPKIYINEFGCSMGVKDTDIPINDGTEGMADPWINFKDFFLKYCEMDQKSTLSQFDWKWQEGTAASTSRQQLISTPHAWYHDCWDAAWDKSIHSLNKWRLKGTGFTKEEAYHHASGQHQLYEELINKFHYTGKGTWTKSTVQQDLGLTVPNQTLDQWKVPNTQGGAQAMFVTPTVFRASGVGGTREDALAMAYDHLTGLLNAEIYSQYWQMGLDSENETFLCKSCEDCPVNNGTEDYPQFLTHPSMKVVTGVEAGGKATSVFQFNLEDTAQGQCQAELNAYNPTDPTFPAATCKYKPRHSFAFPPSSPWFTFGQPVGLVSSTSSWNYDLNRGDCYNARANGWTPDFMLTGLGYDTELAGLCLGSPFEANKVKAHDELIKEIKRINALQCDCKFSGLTPSIDDGFNLSYNIKQMGTGTKPSDAGTNPFFQSDNNFNLYLQKYWLNNATNIAAFSNPYEDTNCHRIVATGSTRAQAIASGDYMWNDFTGNGVMWEIFHGTDGILPQSEYPCASGAPSTDFFKQESYGFPIMDQISFHDHIRVFAVTMNPTTVDGGAGDCASCEEITPQGSVAPTCSSISFDWDSSSAGIPVYDPTIWGAATPSNPMSAHFYYTDGGDCRCVPAEWNGVHYVGNVTGNDIMGGTINVTNPLNQGIVSMTETCVCTVAPSYASTLGCCWNPMDELGSYTIGAGGHEFGYTGVPCPGDCNDEGFNTLASGYIRQMYDYVLQQAKIQLEIDLDYPVATGWGHYNHAYSPSHLIEHMDDCLHGEGNVDVYDLIDAELYEITTDASVITGDTCSHDASNWHYPMMYLTGQGSSSSCGCPTEIDCDGTVALAGWGSGDLPNIPNGYKCYQRDIAWTKTDTGQVTRDFKMREQIVSGKDPVTNRCGIISQTYWATATPIGGADGYWQYTIPISGCDQVVAQISGVCPAVDTEVYCAQVEGKALCQSERWEYDVGLYKNSYSGMMWASGATPWVTGVTDWTNYGSMVYSSPDADFDDNGAADWTQKDKGGKGVERIYAGVEFEQEYWMGYGNTASGVDIKVPGITAISKMDEEAKQRINQAVNPNSAGDPYGGKSWPEYLKNAKADQNIAGGGAIGDAKIVAENEKRVKYNVRRSTTEFNKNKYGKVSNYDSNKFAGTIGTTKETTGGGGYGHGDLIYMGGWPIVNPAYNNTMMTSSENKGLGGAQGIVGKQIVLLQVDKMDKGAKHKGVVGSKNVVQAKMASRTGMAKYKIHVPNSPHGKSVHYNNRKNSKYTIAAIFTNKQEFDAFLDGVVSSSNTTVVNYGSIQKDSGNATYQVGKTANDKIGVSVVFAEIDAKIAVCDHCVASELPSDKSGLDDELKKRQMFMGEQFFVGVRHKWDIRSGDYHFEVPYTAKNQSITVTDPTDSTNSIQLGHWKSYIQPTGEGMDKRLGRTGYFLVGNNHNDVVPPALPCDAYGKYDRIVDYTVGNDRRWSEIPQGGTIELMNSNQDLPVWYGPNAPTTQAYHEYDLKSYGYKPFNYSQGVGDFSDSLTKNLVERPGAVYGGCKACWLGGAEYDGHLKTAGGQDARLGLTAFKDGCPGDSRTS